MSSAPARPVAFSLRSRVAMWIAVAVLICGGVILTLVREGVRQALLHELDLNMRAEADEILLERAQHLDQPQQLYEVMELQALGHGNGIWYSQLFDSQGNLLYATTTTPKRDLQTSSTKPNSQSAFRVLERASQEGADRVTVRLGASLSAVQADMARIDRQVGIAAICVLILAPLSGFLLATIALRPITRMSEQTSQLQPQKLTARLPLSGAHELDRLAGVINDLLNRIAHYIGEHRSLMANAAHQLRTPLAAIRSSVEVVLNADENSPENRDTLASLIEQIESLEMLVNQLLLLAEAEADHLLSNQDAVSLDALVKNCLDMFEAVAESRGITLQVDPMPQVMVKGNRHHLRQVINNLLDNAIKFTAMRQTGPREIKVSLQKVDQQPLARLSLSDSGVGIAPEHLSRIFDRFYRADAARSREQGAGGNGLGLSIVKSVVQAHGGDVTVTSRVGQGTTFIVSLPLATELIVT